MATQHNDEHLDALLLAADDDDLGILIDYITDSGAGRLSLDAEVCQKLCHAKKMKAFGRESRLLIAHELQLFGGNTLMNLFRRGKGVEYTEILCDVASHLKVPFDSGDGVIVIENGILVTLLSRAWEKMSPEEQEHLLKELNVRNVMGVGPVALAAALLAMRGAGFATYKVAAIVATAVAKQLLGRGLAFGAVAPMMRGIGAFMGPVGWALTAAWTLADMASPAYRVTVPCVVQLAYMRRKAAAQFCPECNAPNSPSVKFCGECGYRIANEEADRP